MCTTEGSLRNGWYRTTVIDSVVVVLTLVLLCILPQGGRSECVKPLASSQFLHHSASLHLVDMLPTPPPLPMDDTTDTHSLTSEEGWGTHTHACTHKHNHRHTQPRTQTHTHTPKQRHTDIGKTPQTCSPSLCATVQDVLPQSQNQGYLCSLTLTTHDTWENTHQTELNKCTICYIFYWL